MRALLPEKFAIVGVCGSLCACAGDSPADVAEVGNTSPASGGGPDATTSEPTTSDPTTSGAGVSGSSNGGTSTASGSGGAAQTEPTAGADATTGGESSDGGSSGEQSEAGQAPTAGQSSDAGGPTGGTGAAGEAGARAVQDPGDLEPPEGEYGELPMLPDLFNDEGTVSELAIAEANRKIYLIGGYPSGASSTVTTVQVYDIDAQTWGFAMDHPMALHHPVAVGVDGLVYTLGGQTSGSDTNRSFVYDPESDTWDELASMQVARGAGAAAVIGDRIYVVAGRPPAGNAFEVYDISDDSWTTLPSLPDTYPDRNHLAAAAIGGKVYVAGGRYDGPSFNSPMTDSLDIYDPETSSWDTAARMLRPRGGVNGIAAYGCFYVWGGEGQGAGTPQNVFPDHDVYDPTTDTWYPLDPLPTPIHGVTGSAFVDGLIFMPGGGIQQGGSSGSRIFQMYRPERRCE